MSLYIYIYIYTIWCIQEHRYFHRQYIEYHSSGNGWTLITASAWKNSVNATTGGVGMPIEYIQNQINKIRNLVEDRQSKIAWQMVNEVRRRKSTVKTKLKTMI